MSSLMTAVIELKPDVAKFKKATVDAVQDVTKETGKKLEQGLGDAGGSAGRRVGDGLADGISYDRNGKLRDARGKFVQSSEQMGEEAGQKAASKFSMSWDKLNSLGNKLTLGVTMPIVGGMGLAIKAASDLGETVDASGVIFGDQAKEMQKWGKQAMSTMGLAKNTALEAANSFGGMFNGMGFSSEQAAKMAQQLVERGRDLKSLYNVGSTEEVLVGMRSAMAGETEPLRRFGVNISQVKIEAEALSAGLVQAQVDTAKLGTAQARVRTTSEAAAKALKEHGLNSTEYQTATAAATAAEAQLSQVLEGKVPVLSDTAKAQAIMNIMLRESNVAAGNYRDTQGSAANQMEKTREQLKQLAAEFGQRMLPIVKRVLGALSNLIDHFNHLSPTAQNTILVIGGIAALIGPIAKFASAVRSLIGIWEAVKVSATYAAIAQERAALSGGSIGGMLGKAGLAAGGAYLGYQAVQDSQKGDGKAGWGEVAKYAASGAMLGTMFGPWGTVIGGAVGGAAGLYSHFVGFAEGGTAATPGLAWVGERGKELVHLPAGATVVPHRESMDLASGTSPSYTNYITMNVSVEGRGFDERTLVQHLDQLARRAAATNTRTRRAVR